MRSEAQIGAMTLTKESLRDGVWTGLLTSTGSSEDLPALEALHLDQPIAGLEIEAASDGGVWRVRFPIPAELISDGVQTFVIAEQNTGERLASFALLAGDALAEDIRAEVDLLRAELDMLKRALRRHCLETM